MAYAEKRGKGPQPWRVKYKLPSGLEASESGFETKAAALAWGRDQEARIREGRWIDANARKITVSDWIERWLAMQDVGVSTVDNREYLIRRFIRPALGSCALNSLSTEEITRWENGLPASTGISQRTARAARTLLGTILGDAAAAKPSLIPYNPALRPRNRGRRTGRRLQHAPQHVWATPLQALLLAERAALLSGRDDDFTMIITIGFTGMRWGETIGLEHGYLRPSEIHVEWQLREVNGTFHRLPPKDDSYRSPRWEPGLPIDLPPFLDELLTRQARGHLHQQCACARQHGGSGQYIFLGPDGGHYRRSNYARRVFRPASDGRHEATPSRPARAIITDATTWPGIPVATWPATQPGTSPVSSDQDASISPPRGRGIQAIPGDTPLACWLPVKTGLTPHGLRHSHKTWMEMSRIASHASFGSSREHALPAAQRVALRCRRPSGPPRGCSDLGLHGLHGSDATMMRLIPLRGLHHHCACWHHDASGSSRLHRVHHRRTRQAVPGRHRSCKGRAGPPHHWSRHAPDLATSRSRCT